MIFKRFVTATVVKPPCGTTRCYVDAHTGALEEKKKTRTEFEKREKDEKLKREDYDIESNH